MRLTYERLRGFYEVCGMLTYDIGACIIQNGGPSDNPDYGNDDDEDYNQFQVVRNQHDVLQEIYDVDHQNDFPPRNFMAYVDDTMTMIMLRTFMKDIIARRRTNLWNTR